MTSHQNPTYADAFAVVAGLERLTEDLSELAEEARPLAEELRQHVRQGGGTAVASHLATIRRQLAWLSGDVGRMRAALTREERSTMDVDPITRIYTQAEALRTLAEQQPEEQGGLALILRLLGEDLVKCGEELEDRDTAARRAANTDGAKEP